MQEKEISITTLYPWQGGVLTSTHWIFGPCHLTPNPICYLDWWRRGGRAREGVVLTEDGGADEKEDRKKQDWMKMYR